jgi:hypothetical protein
MTRQVLKKLRTGPALYSSSNSSSSSSSSSSSGMCFNSKQEGVKHWADMPSHAHTQWLAVGSCGVKHSKVEACTTLAGTFSTHTAARSGCRIYITCMMAAHVLSQ